MPTAAKKAMKTKTTRRRSGPRAAGSSPADALKPERIQKVLARAGLASRRQAEEWIRAGRLTINGRAAQLGDHMVASDQLQLDGRMVRQPVLAATASSVLLCHRSPGQALLSTDPDSFAARLPRKAGRRFVSVSPLPQIDGGLELLTADGEMAARLQRTVRTLPMEFSLRVRGELSDMQVEGLKAGLLDSGQRLAVDDVVASGGEGANRWYTLTVVGASGNELRQLLVRQAVTVSRILRVRMGTLQLERSLPRGHSRPLLPAELAALVSPASPASTAADSPANAR
jgi:23S rRNA pseudouridine2605 synthase